MGQGLQQCSDEYRTMIIELVTPYYENDAKKLTEFVDWVIKKKFGGVKGKDMDLYYSIANEVISEACCYEKYDPQKGTFDGYLYNALVFAFIDSVKADNRFKRKNKKYLLDSDGNKVLDENGNPKQIIIMDVSLDSPISADDPEGITYEDIIKSDYSLEDEVFNNLGGSYSDKVNEYINSLSELQKKIADQIMIGNKASVIKETLNITEKQYRAAWETMTSYEKVRVLYKDDYREVREMDVVVNTSTVFDNGAESGCQNTIEKYKNISYSAEFISKQLRKRFIRDDHILQRHSGQWPRFAKSELIVDILRGKSLTQVIISEEIKNGQRMQWLIDGKQRCTTLDEYQHDGFPISKNVKNYMIKYQTQKTDDSGNIVYNEDGFPEVVWKEFDVRGRKFSQLPEDLQDVLKNRQIPVLYNTDCTKKDIAEDIARFNRSRPMNVAQNGWLGLEEGFAELADNITKMPFFQPEFEGTSYTRAVHRSGAIRRIIVEGIMVCDFIDNFSDFDKMCEFLSEEASDSNFTDFYSLVERLTLICDSEASRSLFTQRDSFLWFGLFSRFANIENDDSKFKDFMKEFVESLHEKKIDGVSYDDLLYSRSTKDKKKVIGKIDHLEKLLHEFLNTDIQEIIVEDELKFVQKNVSDEILQDDLDLYNDCLNDIIVKIGGQEKTFDKQNHPSLIAIMAYACCQEEDRVFGDWLCDYISKSNDYIRNQRKNYLLMKKDFDNYVLIQNKESA